MEFLYSITLHKSEVYNIPVKLQMITTFSTCYGTNLVFPVSERRRVPVHRYGQPSPSGIVNM